MGNQHFSRSGCGKALFPPIMGGGKAIFGGETSPFSKVWGEKFHHFGPDFFFGGVEITILDPKTFWGGEG